MISIAKPQPQRVLLFLRLAVCFSLLATAALIGTLSFHFLRHEETLLFETQYNSISNEALNRALELVERQNYAGLTVSTLYGSYNPNISQWPNATIPGIVDTSSEILSLSGIFSFATAPIVRPDEASQFEAFAKEYYSSDPKILPDTGYHDFGFGVFAKDATSPYPDGKIHYTSGNTTYDSPYQILVPVFQHRLLYGPEAQSKALTLLNWRFDANRGGTIDQVITCTLQSETPEKCGSVTDFIELTTDGQPSMIMYHPIFAGDDDSHTIVGVVGAAVTFLSLFRGAIPNYVPSMHAVLSTDTSSYTYVIEYGEPRLLGVNDRHQTKYNEYRQRRHLTSGDMADTARIYALEFYPTDEYVGYYHTNRPLIIALTSAAIIIFTSMVFFLYDYFMKKVSNEQLELLEAKRKFVRFISHEVRTPLNTISLGAKLLNIHLNKIAHASPNTHCIDEITDCIEISEELLDGTDSAVMALNDMIRYDEIDVGVLRLDATLIPIIDLLKTIKKSYDILARDKHIKFELKRLERSDASEEGIQACLELECYRVVGDEMQLMHVFRNLISNAFNHTEARGTVRLEYEWVADGLAENVTSAFRDDERCKYPRAGSVRISVVDTGIGMSKDELLIQRHNTAPLGAEKVYMSPGTGLGLKAARGITERHGGVLNISSGGIGKGCCVTVELPVHSVPAQSLGRSRAASIFRGVSRSLSNAKIAPDIAVSATKQESMLSNAPSITQPSRESQITDVHQFSDRIQTAGVPAEPVVPVSKRVLVVDDAPSTRKILCRLLRNNGHACSEADNGAKAVSAYIYCDERSPFDAILMDYEMPVMNGPTATRILRSLGFTNPIIGITGNVLPEDVQFFKNHGANDVLAKPLKVPELEALWSDVVKLSYSVQTPEMQDTDVYRKIMSDRASSVSAGAEIV